MFRDPRKGLETMSELFCVAGLLTVAMISYESLTGSISDHTNVEEDLLMLVLGFGSIGFGGFVNLLLRRNKI